MFFLTLNIDPIVRSKKKRIFQWGTTVEVGQLPDHGI